MIAPSPITAMTATSRSQPRLGAPLARLPRRQRVVVDPAADVAIRVARSRDEGTLRELQELDGRRLSCGEALLAFLGGRPVAAIALADDTVVADPFVRSAGVVELLHARAQQLRTAA